MDLQLLLDAIAHDAHPGDGKVADYIPALASAPREGFGIAFAAVDGRVLGAGDWHRPFSLQSISKVFAFALVLARDGERLWQRVSREPSGNPFDSLVQLEHERGIPRNPFINAGALIVTDCLMADGSDPLGTLLDLLRTESANASIDVDPIVADSEAAHSHRNAALAHFMASYGNLRNEPRAVLDLYIRQCALAMNCEDVARAGLFLARHGVRADGSRLLTRSEAKRINAILLTCGTYDAAGDFAYRVGLPAKSGVGGGILAILPGRGTLVTWGPALDQAGNSVAGLEAMDRFTTETGWSIF